MPRALTLVCTALLLATLSLMPQGCSAEPTAPARTASMAALGDSITRGFGSCEGAGDCPAASWATGTRPEVDSHFQRLTRRDEAARWQAHNLALSGARVAALDAQARQAVAIRADYVTVLIGGNDACAGSEQAMTPVSSFRRDFASALTTLARGLPDARILVISIPDLQRLWALGHDQPHVRDTWVRSGLCASMLGNPTSDAPRDRERRARVHERVADYNAAMARECARHAGCHWDGNAVHDTDFSLDMVSPRDFWHPSARGQQALAAVSWDAGWP